MNHPLRLFQLTLVSGFILLLSQRTVLAEDVAQPAVAKAEAPAASPAAATPSESPAALSAEEKAKIKDAAQKSVEDEMKAFGSFEIERPDTDELLQLAIVSVKDEVKVQPDGMFVVPADFKDEKDNRYSVDLYLESFDDKVTYEVVDAILVTAGGKPVEEGGAAEGEAAS